MQRWWMVLSLAMAAVPGWVQTLTQVSTRPDTLVYAMTSDARVLVGYSTRLNFPYAFWWTHQTGEVPLPLPTGAQSVTARGVSEDGNTVVGSVALNNQWEPIVWRRQGSGFTYQLLPYPAGVRNITVQGVSGDGRIIAANYLVGETKGCYWLDGVFHYAPASITQINGITRTGIMFGLMGTAYGFRFTLERGVEQLPAGMWALSADGRYGGGSAPNDQILYMDPCGVISLGSAPNGGYGSAYAISDDGRILVGAQRRVGAIRWKRENGFLDGVENLNTTFAPYLGGVVLDGAYALSADGRYIAGAAWFGTVRYACLLDTNGR